MLKLQSSKLLKSFLITSVVFSGFQLNLQKNGNFSTFKKFFLKNQIVKTNFFISNTKKTTANWFTNAVSSVVQRFQQNLGAIDLYWLIPLAVTTGILGIIDVIFATKNKRAINNLVLQSKGEAKKRKPNQILIN